MSARNRPLSVTGRNGPDVVRYNVPAAFPGITSGHTALCQCIWTWHDGRTQLKYVNAMCGEHRAVPRG